MQCRVTLSKCRSNFTGKLSEFSSHSAAPAGEKFRTEQVHSEPFGQGDLADHQNLMPWNELAFGSLIRGCEPQRAPSGSQSRGRGGGGKVKILSLDWGPR
jgi:hypothetical protein